MSRLSLVIPVFNEEENILSLVTAISQNRKTPVECPFELILVNNGSQDNSSVELTKATALGPWIKLIHLTKNVGYGGGIQAGFAAVSSKSSHVGWIPADHQYSVESIIRIWGEVIQETRAVHHGWRKKRLDGIQTRFVSKVYTNLCRIILGIRTRDINGLPKIFPLSFIKKLSFPLSSSFLLDGQLLLAAQKLNLPIRPHPVTFHARRKGCSSWSSQRLRVYKNTFRELLQIKTASRNWVFESE